ncbi:hypothetical protein BIW11_00393 [Tropilaelaps mercedesae]|uniref:Uncharacterized protein n=1 Tax=Tropilaelaps mercedesae TaxID=418985 RepID=A0A1V9XWH5_9ACAR|nr:hypothetical protein BIW11_00393 [Tropilaelaps mercedesae]
MVARTEEAPHKSYYEAAAAKSKNGGRKADLTTQGPLASVRLNTPDETQGVAGAWLTVAVRDIPLKKEENASDLEGKASVAVDEIPLPPPDKRKRFGEKIVSLSGLDNDDADSSRTTRDRVSKVEFEFKRKVNRGNMRQRTADD